MRRSHLLSRNVSSNRKRRYVLCISLFFYAHFLELLQRFYV